MMEHRTSARLQVIVNEYQTLNIAEAFQQYPHLALEALTDAFAFSALGPHSLTSIQLLSIFGCAIRTSRRRTPYRLQALYEECVLQTLRADSIEQQFYQIGGIRALTALCAAATDNKHTKKLLDNLDENEIRHFVKRINNIEPHKDLVFIIETLERGKSNRPSAKRRTKQLNIPGRGHRNKHQRTNARSQVIQGKLDERIY
jgi:hypothetical protein